MNIAIIGAGNVGSTLALGFKKAGHSVIFGIKDTEQPFKGKEFATEYSIPCYNVAEAVSKSDVIVLCTPAQVAHQVAQSLGDVQNKVIIDTMNAVFSKPAHYTNSTEALTDNCNCKDIVKCFNSTGVENMANPAYQGQLLDMFIAGTSERAKQVAVQLAKDIGFGEIYDFGGLDKCALLEQFALCWINLAILQKQGRNIGFKLLRR